MGVTALQDNMGIKEISIAGSEKVKVDLAPIDELKATTQCCCTACSFYTKWPECCGVNKRDMLCCCSTELGFGCFPVQGRAQEDPIGCEHVHLLGLHRRE